jgi:hypothetical protein
MYCYRWHTGTEKVDGETIFMGDVYVSPYFFKASEVLLCSPQDIP